MARRPGTRSVATATAAEMETPPAHIETSFVTQLAEYAASGDVAEDELPDFLTGPIVPPEPDPEPIPEERWDRPFASGKAPSDIEMEQALASGTMPDFLNGGDVGRPAEKPPTDLPVGAARRGRGNRSVR